jgi:SAM-dependent methyltransferase
MSEAAPSTTPGFVYIGDELALFARATNWKRYFSQRLRPFILGDVLEVGAGLGGTSEYLHHLAVRSWGLLEPDRRLADQLAEKIKVSALPGVSEIHVGTLVDLPTERTFDTLIYIDVLEHIEDDAGELVRAVGRLRPGGRIIVLAPAHQWLYTPFDQAIGHFRRYDRASLTAVTPAGAVLERCFYLDSVGLLASLGNRLVLKSARPSAAQIATWDRFMVPVSRWVDPILGRRLGKSVVAVWRRPSGT